MTGIKLGRLCSSLHNNTKLSCTSEHTKEMLWKIQKDLILSVCMNFGLCLLNIYPFGLCTYYKHFNIVWSLIWPQLFCNFYLFYISNVKIHSFTHLPLSIKPTASFYQTNSKLWKWRILIFGFDKNFNLIFLKAYVMMTDNDQNKGGR